MTDYIASSTPRRADGVPVNRADAAFLSRRHGMFIFAATPGFEDK